MKPPEPGNLSGAYFSDYLTELVPILEKDLSTLAEGYDRLEERLDMQDERIARLEEIIDRRKLDYPPKTTIPSVMVSNSKVDVPPYSNAYEEADSDVGTIEDYSERAVRVKMLNGWELIMKERLDDHFKLHKLPLERLEAYKSNLEPVTTKPEEDDKRGDTTEGN